MKKMMVTLAALLAVPMIALATAPATVSAQVNLQGGVNSAQGEGAAGEISDPGNLVKTIVNALLWLIGILSVIMLIWGGITYTTSAGDSNKVTSAKNTIMYAVIGLVVAIFAYAIVNFVVLKTSGV